MARKKDIAADVDAIEAADPSEVRVYEIAFHLDPELSESEAKRAYEAVREAAGTVVAEGTPEKVQLAYTISRSETAGRRDFDSAYFCWVAYEGDASVHEAVQAAVKAENRVIRSLDIRTEKEVALHAAEQRELREKVPAPAEEVSDAELTAALEGANA